MYIRLYSKDRIECSKKLFLTTKQLCHTAYIVRYKEAILPGCGFRIGTTYLNRIEGSFPVPIHPLGAEEFCITIKNIDIVLGTLNILLINIILTHFLSHTCNTPVIIGKLQQTRDGLFLYIRRNKAILNIVISSLFVLFRRNYHSFQRLFRVKSSNTLHISICYNGHCMITNHSSRLSGRKRPDRKFTRRFVNVQKGIYHIIDQSCINQSHQRIPCTESIPKRKCRILHFAFWQLPNFHIMTAVLTIDITHDIGYNHRMIHGCIEILQVVRIAAFYRNSRESLFPSGTGSTTHGIKIETYHLGFQILTCILFTDNG